MGGRGVLLKCYVATYQMQQCRSIDLILSSWFACLPMRHTNLKQCFILTTIHTLPAQFDHYLVIALETVRSPFDHSLRLFRGLHQRNEGVVMARIKVDNP